MGGLVASGQACDDRRSRRAAACSRPEAHDESDHARRRSVQLLAAKRGARPARGDARTKGFPAPGTPSGPAAKPDGDYPVTAEELRVPD